MVGQDPGKERSGLPIPFPPQLSLPCFIMPTDPFPWLSVQTHCDMRGDLCPRYAPTAVDVFKYCEASVNPNISVYPAD